MNYSDEEIIAELEAKVLELEESVTVLKGMVSARDSIINNLEEELFEVMMGEDL